MAFSRVITGESVVVSENAARAVTFLTPVQGAPAERVGAETTSADAKKAISIATALAAKVRAMLGEGAFNNEMICPDATRYITTRSPKFLNDTVDNIYYQLGEMEKETDTPDWHKQMAALAWAARRVGGGVCSMIAHVGLGELTTFAEANTEAMLVVDKNFDHSYLVIGHGRSAWFTCDPWVGDVYVTPWADCFFPRTDVSIYYKVTVHKAVSVPYGHEFSALEMRKATQAGVETKAKWGTEMDHHYVHTTNVLSAKKHLYDPVLKPQEWGDALGRARGSAFDIFG